MSGNEYVRQILAKYRVPRGEASITEKTAREIYPIVKKWAGEHLNAISLSGSYAKGTAVGTGTDVDLFISIKSNVPVTLSKLYNSLFRLVSSRGWNARRQNVSVGVTVSGVKVDLVPGRVQSGYRNYHSLYRSKTDSWTQTNVALHIDKIKASGRKLEIQALKIWRDLRGLDFPSLYLELVVLKALHNLSSSPDKLARNVLKCLEFIQDSISSARIVDPANSNNLLSDELNTFQKNQLALAAKKSLNEEYWESIIW